MIRRKVGYFFISLIVVFVTLRPEVSIADSWEVTKFDWFSQNMDGTLFFLPDGKFKTCYDGKVTSNGEWQKNGNKIFIKYADSSSEYVIEAKQNDNYLEGYKKSKRWGTLEFKAHAEFNVPTRFTRECGK